MHAEPFERVAEEVRGPRRAQERREARRFRFRQRDDAARLAVLVPDAEADVRLLVARAEVPRDAKGTSWIELRMPAKEVDELPPLDDAAPRAEPEARLQLPPAMDAVHGRILGQDAFELQEPFLALEPAGVADEAA